MIIKTVSSEKEMQQIKALQSQNLKTALEPSEIESQGFVSAEYTIDFIKKMNAIAPSIIAVENNEVVGYALVTTKAILGEHDLLDNLLNKIDQLSFKGRLLGQENYIVVGQLCVAKSHRGQGLVKQLYSSFKTRYATTYSLCVTDVDRKNIRSIRAHLKTGFEVIGALSFGNSQWDIVLWDWNA
jgi:ribosomal protein S18 acetylase RimI-like enzyme